MATDVKTYNPAKVQVTIGGVIITGFEPGTFITLTRNVNNYDFSVSPDGSEGVRSKRNDRSALLTLTMQQASVANFVLSNLANRDEVDSDGVVPVQINEIGTDTEFVSAKGWIEKPSDAVYAETAQGRPWAIRLADVPMTHGGNPTTAALQSTLT